MEKQKEDRLIQEVLNGDHQRFALLVDAYKGPVFNLAYRMTGSYSDAEDLAQDAFLRAFEQLARYDPRKKFFTWLYTIALNLIRTHLRRKNRGAFRQLLFRDFGQNNDENPIGDNPETRLLEDEAQRRLMRALMRLSAKDREIIVLRFYQGLSFSTVADILNMSQSAAKMRVYRSLERLRKFMSRQAG